FGVREMGGNDPVTPDTLMLIGSTTKTMTTMLMAQLVDDGIMDWDTPVVDIMPTFTVADPEITQMITVQHLVCACTGVPRRDFEMIFNSEDTGAEGIIESLADFEFFTGFGEAFQYSNQMVATGGYVAAMAAGGEYGNLYEDYLALMQERIFDTVGMPNTTFSFDKAKASGNYGIPHDNNIALEYSPMSLDVEEALLGPVVPAGGAWSNVMDMARYLVTELDEGVAPDGTRVVSAENLKKTWEPQVAITDDASYGLGWIVDEYKGLKVLHHGGNTNGFTSDLAFIPDVDLGISVLTNQYGSLFNQLVRFRLLELMYQQDPQFEEAAQFQIDMMKKASDEVMAQIQESINTEEIAPYLGQYSNAALGDITVQWQQDKLIFDSGEFQAEIRARINDEGELSYVLYDSLLSGLPVKTEETEDGRYVIVIGLGVNEYTFEKVE
ncbi:MAG: serine hydrolase domain-containing protein, partial [Chloroflexota bacterium]|nr:serine hydrolase domain-containing protein [Chloroflexota bacterium]